MNKTKRNLLMIAGVLTVIVAMIWQVTGGDFYTKYEVVEEREKELDQSDPLVAAGFYDNTTVTETVTRDEFRLGLLPTPAGLFDKHFIAVVTLLVPIYFIIAVLWWHNRRKSIVR